MVIKNNFNQNSIDPLKDYNSIGKGSHSLDKLLDDEKNGFIRENMENPVLQDLRDDNSRDDIEDEDDGDNWKFFR